MFTTFENAGTESSRNLETSSPAPVNMFTTFENAGTESSRNLETPSPAAGNMFTTFENAGAKSFAEEQNFFAGLENHDASRLQPAALVFEESAILDLPAGHMRMGRDGYDSSSKQETQLGTVRVGGVDLGTGTNPCCAAPASACFLSECWFDHYEWKHKQALRSVSMILQ